MRPKAKISLEEIERLRAGGWSLQRIARYAGVSKSTIKNRLKAKRPRDPEVLAFARQIELLADNAPNELARYVVVGAVLAIRQKAALSRTAQKQLVLREFEFAACRDAREIAEDLGLPLGPTVDLLDELAAEGVLEKTVPGGSRGRRSKFRYGFYPRKKHNTKTATLDE